ncbi:hypothetical protein CALVIDRAFT_303002 [Calocera viscosa TUFC12733]|uniref:Uncharacterized protein n=1 Tax=Calocera viscosa (strain TUFC12733) TaxID=1330018 RepID=A0A167IEL0_CALVF|nr:hypothetical protein CALVIDRAFT_303002 [Calocera viscosa TUFC12733]
MSTGSFSPCVLRRCDSQPATEHAIGRYGHRQLIRVPRFAGLVTCLALALMRDLVHREIQTRRCDCCDIKERGKCCLQSLTHKRIQLAPSYSHTALSPSMPPFLSVRQVVEPHLRVACPVEAGGVYAVLIDNGDGTFRFAIFVCSDKPGLTGDLHQAILTHPYPRYPMYSTLSEHELGVHDIQQRTDIVCCIAIGRAGRGKKRDLQRVRRIIYDALGGQPGIHRQDLREPYYPEQREFWKNVQWWRTAMVALINQDVVTCDDLLAFEEEATRLFGEFWANARNGICITVLLSLHCPNVPWTYGL